MKTRARRALLVAALGFLALQWRYKPAAVGPLERWLHSWRGAGDVINGMHAQGFDVELRAFSDHWRATFYPVGLAHSIVYGFVDIRFSAEGRVRAWIDDVTVVQLPRA